MKIPDKIFLIIFFSIFLVRCEKHDVISKPFPSLKTLAVSDISEDGATFNAEITFRENFRILSYGFVWSEKKNPKIENSEKIIYSENLQNNTFFARISTRLKQGINYHVRPFIETQSHRVYGQDVIFLSLGSKAPQIEMAEPITGTIGDTIKIFGQNFSFFNDINNVFFGDIKAKTIFSNDTLIIAIVPSMEISESLISVSIHGNRATLKEIFHILSPVIQSVFPTVASFSDTITIQGKYFSPSKEDNHLFLEDIPITIISISRTKIKFLLPDNLQYSQNTLFYKLAGETISYKYIHLSSPVINSVSPKYITTFYMNGILELHGQNYSSLINKNKVYINTIEANILSSSHEIIKVELPTRLMHKKDLSLFDTLKIALTVYGKDTSFNGQIIIDYHSRWTRMHDFPGNPRIFATSFSINGKGYAGLGVKTDIGSIPWNNDFYEYDPASDSWRRLSDFPETWRCKTVSLVLNDKAYIITSYLGEANTESDDYSHVWEYDPSTDTWNQKNDFPGKARCDPFGFTIDDRGYMGGGIYEREPQFDFWRYDSNTDTWTQLNNLSDKQWNEYIFSISDNVNGYIFGSCGRSCSRQYNWKYNESNDTWSQIANMPRANREITGFLLGDKLYIGTGIFSNYKGTNAFFEYDPNTDIFTYMNFIEERRAASSFSIGNYGYLFMGMSDSETDVWKFDPTKP